MKQLTAIYVDDELPALELIKDYCLNIPEIDLIRCFTNPVQAMEFLQEQPVDLLILDIEMPELSGVEFAKKLEKNQLIIFITADPTHAVQAFELDVIDYLVKPVFPERLAKALKKAVDIYSFQETNKDSNYLVFKSDYMMNRLQKDEVLWVEGSGEYIKIVTRFKSYMVLRRLSDFIESHSAMGFVRIHRSYIVLKENIKSHNSQMVILKDGSQLPVGRSYKVNF
ncbi:Transcriptional regulatory protein YpdB [compost metagenome]